MVIIKGVIAAQSGELTFMVGGDKEIFEKAKGVLGGMGKKLVHCGDIGMGQAAKICNNMLLGITMAGVAEAMNLGIRLGLDGKLLMDIVNNSTGRCWSSEIYNPVPGLMPNVPSARNYEVCIVYYKKFFLFIGEFVDAHSSSYLF